MTNHGWAVTCKKRGALTIRGIFTWDNVTGELATRQDVERMTRCYALAGYTVTISDTPDHGLPLRARTAAEIAKA